jgi:hypothetical protein
MKKLNILLIFGLILLILNLSQVKAIDTYSTWSSYTTLSYDLENGFTETHYVSIRKGSYIEKEESKRDIMRKYFDIVYFEYYIKDITTWNIENPTNQVLNVYVNIIKTNKEGINISVFNKTYYPEDTPSVTIRKFFSLEENEKIKLQSTTYYGSYETRIPVSMIITTSHIPTSEKLFACLKLVAEKAEQDKVYMDALEARVTNIVDKGTKIANWNFEIFKILFWIICILILLLIIWLFISMILWLVKLVRGK